MMKSPESLNTSSETSKLINFDVKNIWVVISTSSKFGIWDIPFGCSNEEPFDEGQVMFLMYYRHSYAYTVGPAQFSPWTEIPLKPIQKKK